MQSYGGRLSASGNVFVNPAACKLNNSSTVSSLIFLHNLSRQLKINNLANVTVLMLIVIYCQSGPYIDRWRLLETCCKNFAIMRTGVFG
jgi:hypothetical protein